MSNCGCASGDDSDLEDEGEVAIRFEQGDRYEEESPG
jgi:hypothetical protein